MKHKRRRAKRQRAGCGCGGKAAVEDVMTKRRVMARDHKGRPLDRLAVSTGNSKVFILNPNGSASSAYPIGFPNEDVFEFDPSLFRDLNNAFESRDFDSLGRLWRTARRYKPTVAA